jgi:osmoprotectant transport system permease protein
MSDALSEQLALLPDYLGGHLLLTIAALAIGIAVCLPTAFLITRVKPLQWPTLTFAGVMQTIPGIALLALMVPILGQIGFLPALIALILYSMLPIIRNTVTGILGVDPALTEAARGIGMTSSQTLFKIEIPLAMPVIIAGIRTATVWVVGTATLSTPVGATSLGNYIFSGLQTQNPTAVIVGCVAAAGLAIILDQLIRLVEIATTRRSRKLVIIAALLLLIVLGGGLYPVLSHDKISDGASKVIIGAKPFTEQYILAELMARILDDAGFETETKTSMGSTILFDALADGHVDCYIDYSGTVWANHMKREDNPAADVVLSEMTHWLSEQHGIVCLGPLGFENTYALAMPRVRAERLGIRTIVDLALHSRTMTIGSDYEFFSRPEWTALEGKYDLQCGEKLTCDPTLMDSAINQ